MQQVRPDVAAPKKIKISLLGPACISKILISSLKICYILYKFTRNENINEMFYFFSIYSYKVQENDKWVHIVKWWISHQNNSLNSFTSGTVCSS